MRSNRSVYGGWGWGGESAFLPVVCAILQEHHIVTVAMSVTFGLHSLVREITMTSHREGATAWFEAPCGLFHEPERNKLDASRITIRFAAPSDSCVRSEIG